MGKGDDAGALMTAAELRPLLHVAKQKPVNCAVALSKDKVGLIVLHKKTRPKKLLAELKAQAKAKGITLETTSLRFGHVSVDGSSDSGMATFEVNKPAPGPMKRALLEQVRPAGLQRCEIVVNEGLENETDDEAPGEAAPGNPAPRQPADAVNGAGTPTGRESPSRDSPGPPAGNAPAVPTADAAPAPDEGASAAASLPGASSPGWQDRLRPALAGLVRQVATASERRTPRRDELSALADQANAAIKAGDRDSAVAGVRSLHEALAGAPEPAPQGSTGEPPSPATPDERSQAAAALRAGFDGRAAVPRDRSADVQVADNTPRDAATDAGGPGNGTARAASTPAPAVPASAAATDDDSWRSADGWDYRPVPPGTPPVVMDVPRALGEFDDAHGKVLTRTAGAGQALGAAFEGLGAGGLLLTPEPTMLTKVAGTAMGANAFDNLQAGVRTAWTGQYHQTMTAQAAGAGAQALGASPEQATRIAAGTDVIQGLAGGGAMTISGIARDGAGAAARGAGALERGASPALTGDVLPPNQLLALGATEVRQAPAQPAWPQTVTAGPGQVELNGPAVQPREPPQLAPPPEPPPPTAEQQVQALPGHGHSRHGMQTTLAEQENRLRTGKAPDGKNSPTKLATRFDSHDAEHDAVTRATTEMAARERAGLLPRNVINAYAPGKKRRPELPSIRLVVTGRPGGYGAGLSAAGSKSSTTLLPTGQLPNARVTFERDPLRGWIPVTQFPTGEPPTPLTPPPP